MYRGRGEETKESRGRREGCGWGRDENREEGRGGVSERKGRVHIGEVGRR